MIIKKSLTTEKSFKGQDKGKWTFIVHNDASKIDIKHAVESLFGAKVEKVTVSNLIKKTRRLRGDRVHTRRPATKIARVSLKDKAAKIDLTKLNK